MNIFQCSSLNCFILFDFILFSFFFSFVWFVCTYNVLGFGCWFFIIQHKFCTHHETSQKKDFPTFARTRPPDTQISKSVASLLLAYNWTQVLNTLFYLFFIGNFLYKQTNFGHNTLRKSFDDYVSEWEWNIFSLSKV